jgi:hypothetical protein
MSISEKANDLLNKFGRAQFDFVVWNTPDNLVARDKARQEISDYIEELEAENTALKQHPQPIEFWSDEKKELYRRNESRTIKSGREEERER